jgi:hypothetical protein
MRDDANAAPDVGAYATETVALGDLRAHPANYREHPTEQREHLLASIREYGIYRNIVVARDGTILAGHGVVEAAREGGLEAVPVVRLDLDADDPRALRLLAGDNEIARLAQTDARALADLLGEIGREGWLGTGFDDGAFALLLAELDGADPAGGDWAGMPPYETADHESAFRSTVHFRTPEDATAFFALIGRQQAASFWWPEGDGHVGSDIHSRYVNPE